MGTVKHGSVPGGTMNRGGGGLAPRSAVGVVVFLEVVLLAGPRRRLTVGAIGLAKEVSGIFATAHFFSLGTCLIASPTRSSCTAVPPSPFDCRVDRLSSGSGKLSGKTVRNVSPSFETQVVHGSAYLQRPAKSSNLLLWLSYGLFLGAAMDSSVPLAWPLTFLHWTFRQPRSFCRLRPGSCVLRPWRALSAEEQCYKLCHVNNYRLQSRCQNFDRSLNISLCPIITRYPSRLFACCSIITILDLQS